MDFLLIKQIIWKPIFAVVFRNGFIGRLVIKHPYVYRPTITLS